MDILIRGMEMPKSCFSCANAFVDDEDNLHCMADGHNKEETVEDDYSCADWN